MKPRARYTPRLKSWAWWESDGWSIRLVGFGDSMTDAYLDWLAQSRRSKA